MADILRVARSYQGRWCGTMEGLCGDVGALIGYAATVRSTGSRATAIDLNRSLERR